MDFSISPLLLFPELLQADFVQCGRLHKLGHSSLGICLPFNGPIRLVDLMLLCASEPVTFPVALAGINRLTAIGLISTFSRMNMCRYYMVDISYIQSIFHLCTSCIQIKCGDA